MTRRVARIERERNPGLVALKSPDFTPFNPGYEGDLSKSG
jgi:hypothetical protein